jgi:hypothetical protein
MAEIIPFPGKQQTESLAGAQLPNPTAGRVLALNPEKIKRFQCRGFWLNSRTPYARVPAEASSGQLRAALDDGRLLDITDQIEDYRRGGSPLILPPGFDDPDKYLIRLTGYTPEATA